MQKLPTRIQLEKKISQKLQLVYSQQFGCSTSKISCYLLSNKLAIVVENTTTKIEAILQKNNRFNIADDVRSVIEKTFISLIKPIIANILQVEVVDIISDFSANNNILGILVFLNDCPQTKSSAKKTYQRSRQKIQNAEENK